MPLLKLMPVADRDTVMKLPAVIELRIGVVPDAVKRHEATLLVLCSVSHKLPSGPMQMKLAPAPADGSVYSVMVPLVVTDAMRSVAFSQTHKFPSGPAQIP